MKDLIKKILNENIINEIGGKRIEDTDVIFKSSDVVILAPKSFESSKSFSRGTKYCTGGDCSGGNDTANQRMFDSHSEGGDVMFRIFFKDRTKVRLTWGDEFHWGLGRKDDYHVFTDRHQFGYSDNPLDFTTLIEVRRKQLKLQSSWMKWLKFEKDYLNTKNAKSIWDLDEDDQDELLDKRNLMVSGSYWWSEGKETLYKYMLKLPNEALENMKQYKEGSKLGWK